MASEKAFKVFSGARLPVLDEGEPFEGLRRADVEKAERIA